MLLPALDGVFGTPCASQVTNTAVKYRSACKGPVRAGFPVLPLLIREKKQYFWCGAAPSSFQVSSSFPVGEKYSKLACDVAELFTFYVSKSA